jgi:hypothetical protein
MTRKTVRRLSLATNAQRPLQDHAQTKVEAMMIHPQIIAL